MGASPLSPRLPKKKEPSPVIVVTGHIKIDPKQIERLRPAARAVLEATRAEDGCILYAYAEDLLEPGLIRIVERWRDWDSLTAHGSAPHLDVWRTALTDAGGVFDREVTAHEAGTERAL
jgi:quinol monooxygenase YgiN